MSSSKATFSMTEYIKINLLVLLHISSYGGFMEKLRMGSYEIQKQTVEEYKYELEAKLEEHIADFKNVKNVYYAVKLGSSYWYKNKLIETGWSKELMLEFEDGTFGYTQNYGYDNKCVIVRADLHLCVSAVIGSIEII